MPRKTLLFYDASTRNQCNNAPPCMAYHPAKLPSAIHVFQCFTGRAGQFQPNWESREASGNQSTRSLLRIISSFTTGAAACSNRRWEISVRCSEKLEQIVIWIVYVRLWREDATERRQCRAVRRHHTLIRKGRGKRL